MGRKQQLIDTVNQHLKRDHQSTLKNRQYRYFVLMKIANDFYTTKMVPASWYALTDEHIKALVNMWRNKGLKASTIMNYMICLRYFLKLIQHEIANIDNKNLNLCKPRNNFKPDVDSEMILSTIEEPIAFLLFALQIYFGLTLHEAMHIIPAIHIQDKKFWITRELSINHKDRVIPIISQKQSLIITKLIEITGLQNSLVKQFGECRIRLAYKFALTTLNLSSQINYRYLYAKARFADLSLHYKRSESKKILAEEMSINKTSPLWKTIYEQH